MTSRPSRVRAAAAAAFLVLAVAPAGWSAVSEEVRFLPSRREVRPATSILPGGWVVVAEDDALARDAAPDFSDVRFLNEAGEILPVTDIPPRLKEESTRLLTTRPVPWQKTGEGDWIATIDLGPDAPPSLLLQPVGGAPPPSTTVETSDDGSNWLPLAPLYDVEAGYRSRPLPPDEGWRFKEAKRHLRLAVHRDAPGITLPDSVRVFWWEIRDVPVEWVEFHPTEAGFRGRTWEKTFFLRGPARGVAGVQVSGIAVLLNPVPSVTIEAQFPHGGWTRLTPEWSLPDQDRSPAGKYLEFDPVRTAAIRLRVENADPPNPPFEVSGVAVVPHRWCIPPPVPEKVWLAYGDQHLEPRSWNLGDPTRRLDSGPVEATLGPPEPNPFYAAPGFGLEWLKRRPAVLAAAMVGVLALVGLVVWRGQRSGP